MPTAPETDIPCAIARPLEAAFAPWRLYAQAFATAQEATSLWLQAWMQACEGARTLGLQQVQLAGGLTNAMRAAAPDGEARSGSEVDPQVLNWPFGRMAAAAARVAQAFDSDPRWTAPANPPESHPPH